MIRVTMCEMRRAKSGKEHELIERSHDVVLPHDDVFPTDVIGGGKEHVYDVMNGGVSDDAKAGIN